jgi:gamma-glutamylcyclotransferase (GGCT)/AIG2-like uncharacterized protein YtfP
MAGDSSQFLFVYGTLMSGESRYPLLIPGGIRSILAASVHGILFHLGQYPGMVLSSEPNDIVVGELIEFQNLNKILRSLDEEEGREYRREMVKAILGDGNPRTAWSFVLAVPSDGLPIIESGDWRSAPKKSS